MANRKSKGFSIFEMLVAMAVFLVVASAAFFLFNKHLALVTEQQSLSSVNIGLRNAMSQLELDLAAAGPNLFSGVQQAGSPVQPFSLGVLIRNNTPAAAGACAPNANWSYPTSQACFDSMTLLQPKPCTLAGGATAPVLVTNDPGQSGTAILNSSNIFVTDLNPGAVLANDIQCFKKNDEVLFVQVAAGTLLACDPTQPAVLSTYCVGVVQLTQDANTAGANGIKLQHNPTGGGADAAGDPLNIVFNSSGSNNFAKANGFSYPFDATGGTYVVDLGDGSQDITYSVITSATDPSNDQLVRCNGATCTAANAQVLTDQVIGFKIGAILWDNAKTNATDDANYFYDASKYCTDAVAGADCSTTPPPANDPNDFTLVRAVRVSMIARTVPKANSPALPNFKNGFDGGPYLVQQGSVSVDLRSITNSDILD